jgi:DNA modification methylase
MTTEQRKAAVQFTDQIREFRRVRAGDLLPNPENYRRHPKRQVDLMRAVLAEIGYVNALMVRETADGLMLIDGHLRQSLEPDQIVPVVILDVDAEGARKILATFDPLTGMADEDADDFAALLSSVKMQDAALQDWLEERAAEMGAVYGDDDDALAMADDPGADIDRADELQKQWGTERGQLWAFEGGHRLLCGDSTVAADVARLMGGKQAQILWTDPPYGVEYVGKTKDALRIENDGAMGLAVLLVGAFANATIACEPGAPWYVAHPAGLLSLTFGDAIRASGWRMHQTLIWVKDSMVLGHSDYHYKHEPIYYGYMPGAGRSGRGSHEGSRWYGDNAQVSVIEIPRPKRSEEHPTMKPPDLIAHCLNNSSPAGAIVLDLFCGSGSTLVAAAQGGRIGYGCEIDPRYVAVVLERMAGMGLQPRLVTEE